MRVLSRAAAGMAGAAIVALTFAAPATAARSGEGGSAPGSLTGYGFDSCSAPAQAVMDAWWDSSPYSAVGIYIGGSNRLCDQPELTADWVRTQLRRGWHLVPAYVGPQASCSSYPDKMSSDLDTAEQQGLAQAKAAVAAARSLGIGRGSTLYYDLEDYDIAPDDCRRAALSFLSGWTKGLHAKQFSSGVYSNMAAAITSLDYADLRSPGSYVMPDDIWFAWANDKANTATDGTVRKDSWADHQRIHQYAVGVTASYGGYSLSIDESWLDVGKGSVAAPAKPLCKGVSVDLRRYPALKVGDQGPAVSAAQCLLRHEHLSKRAISGHYDKATAASVTRAQKKLGLPSTGRLDRATWAALLARGSQPVLKVGSTGDAVRRLERALTAALGKSVTVDGVYTAKTAKAVRTFQQRTGLPTTGVVTPDLWQRL